MPLWHAVVLGIVQGLTEFLPISSTAHLLLVRQLLGHPHPDDAFTVVIQLGTLVAVVAYFRIDLRRILAAVWADLRERRLGTTVEGRLAWFIVLGTVPAVAVGFLFKRQLKETFFNLPAVAVVATAFAVLLAAAEWWARRRAARGLPDRNDANLTWLDALWIGCWQACALMPGGSRSGTTLTGGLFAGLGRAAAARFSFLLSVPVILGAGLKDLLDEYKKLRAPEPDGPPSLFASADDAAALLVGTLVSAVVGYLAVAWLLHFLKRYSTVVFVAYRLLLGSAIGGAVLAGWLK
ncbi:Undecaprenyl-diphosphatase [Urbifossiella limnaea]|uniref:Undecaprenyl-diphosphatase n=2 Tax=Urbifossiella limnaea TaxID=2528023 RepID=A0A517XS04_9BACT|nr:Undecaprenyl-diphosphatase [Urbifossiella limnaea]